MSRSPTKLSFVDNSSSISKMQQFPPFHGEKKVEISLIDVDYAEAVDAVVPSVFKDHGVYDLFPPVEHVACVDAEVYYLENQFGD